MKKQQKEQIKAGGEMARKIYQAYMALPEWMTHIDKKKLSEFLKSAIEAEEAIADQLLESYKRSSQDYSKTDDIDILRQSNLYLTRATEKHLATREARTLLRMIDGAPLHLDFSMYCRDN